MILLISGPAGVGKTSITDVLEKSFNYQPLKSSKYLREIANKKNIPITRENLQLIGDQLDDKTDFQWIVEEVAKPQILIKSSNINWLLDSVRKKKQVSHFRSEIGWKIFHMHITASGETIKTRFSKRLLEQDNLEYEQCYEKLIKHPNEIESRSLGKIADGVLHYEDITPSEAAQKIISKLGRI